MKIAVLLIVLSSFLFINKTLSTPVAIKIALPVSVTQHIKKEQSKELKQVILPFTTTVVHVVDGDTFDVLIDGKKERVRALGINTPETVDPRKTVECFGKEASQKAKELLFNKDVRLEKDPSQGERDKYGRLLRYVTRDDDLFFNQWMIENGYAYEYTYDVPYRFQMVFKEAQRTARKEAVGLWAPGVCGNNF